MRYDELMRFERVMNALNFILPEKIGRSHNIRNHQSKELSIMDNILHHEKRNRLQEKVAPNILTERNRGKDDGIDVGIKV